MENEICECCGAKLKKYWHRISPGLVRVLVKCYEHVSKSQENKFFKKDLVLDHNEYGNFQKLRFHGLIAKLKENGQIVRGGWVMTSRGADFLKGQIQIPKRVQTFRDHVTDHDDILVTVTDVMKDQPTWETDFSYDIFKPVQKPLLIDM